MIEPWFENPNAFGAYFGAVVGTTIGVAGGLLGSCSFFVQRGQGKPWIVGGYVTLLVVGVTLLLIGIAAIASGQPYAIWYPLLIAGVVATIVFGILLPTILKQYRVAEQRKIDSAGLQ